MIPKNLEELVGQSLEPWELVHWYVTVTDDGVECFTTAPAAKQMGLTGRGVQKMLILTNHQVNLVVQSDGYPISNGRRINRSGKGKAADQKYKYLVLPYVQELRQLTPRERALLGFPLTAPEAALEQALRKLGAMPDEQRQALQLPLAAAEQAERELAEYKLLQSTLKKLNDLFEDSLCREWFLKELADSTNNTKPLLTPELERDRP